MRPVIYGEVLFDIFPDSRTLGGAAFNVAWHLHAFGASPLFISRVGSDTHGETITKAMNNQGMDTSGLQYDVFHPTGQVHIETQNTEHSFNIIPDQAYDYINTEEALRVLPSTTSLLYHGSLITRNPVSHATLTAIRNATPTAEVFIDINLRTPWWNKHSCLELMSGANWIKINDEELDALSHPSHKTETLSYRAQALRNTLNTKTLIITRSERGALIYTNDGEFSYPPKCTKNIIDTVGAGDSFSAVMIYGKLKGWSHKTSLERAQDFAQEICRHRGAILQDKSLYQKYTAHWEQEDNGANLAYISKEPYIATERHCA